MFDGAAPQCKKEELCSRRAAEEKAGGVARPSAKLTAEVKACLSAAGYEVVQAHDEAEAECARMDVWGVISEDSDTLVFGAKHLIRNVTSANLSRGFTVISLERILQEMNLTMSQFVDVSILCGCDFTGTVHGIGPATAVKLIRTHGNIEGIASSQKWCMDTCDFAMARNMFNHDYQSPETTESTKETATEETTAHETMTKENDAAPPMTTDMHHGEDDFDAHDIISHVRRKRSRIQHDYLEFD